MLSPWFGRTPLAPPVAVEFHNKLPKLVHGQVMTIIFVVSVCLFVCLSVCLCRVFLSYVQNTPKKYFENTK